jgi:ABC-type multidrug transport system permease subunit
VCIDWYLQVGTIYLQLGNDQASIQDRLGALFFMATNQAFGMLGSLNVFLEERNLVNRERAGGAYRTSAYFMAKTFVEAPFFLLFPLIFATIAYWMIGLQPSAGHFGIFLGNLVLFAAGMLEY